VGRQVPSHLPFVVTELVTMVICRDDVNQQDILGLGVHACDFYLVAGEHPPDRAKGGVGCGQSIRRNGIE
jgi:hypothetical protein